MSRAVRRTLVVVVVVVLLTVIGYGARLFSRQDLCTAHNQPIDTTETTTLEEKDLMRAMSAERHRVQQGFEKELHIPAALDVKVSGSTANVRIDSQLDSGDYAYAAIWYRIYHKYHSGKSCVSMNLTWDSHTVQREWPPPLTL